MVCFFACNYLCDKGILINFGCINFLKICGVAKEKYGCKLKCVIFQSEDMLNLCFNFNESQPLYVYKCYAYKKDQIQSNKTFSIFFLRFKKVLNEKLY